MTATKYISGRVAGLVCQYRTTTTRIVALRLQAQHYAKERNEIIAQLGEYHSAFEIAGLVGEPPSEVEAMMRCANDVRDRHQRPGT